LDDPDQNNNGVAEYGAYVDLTDQPQINQPNQTVNGQNLNEILDDLKDTLRDKHCLPKGWLTICKNLREIDAAKPMILASNEALTLADANVDYTNANLDDILPDIISRHKALGGKGITFYRDWILGLVFAKIKADKQGDDSVDAKIAEYLAEANLGKSGASQNKYSVISQILTMSPRMQYANGAFSDKIVKIGIRNWNLMTSESPSLRAYFTMPKNQN